jgi:hypothetical protein
MILQLIFIKSLEEHNVPKDWLVANVTALFKKGDKSQPHDILSVPLALLGLTAFSRAQKSVRK